MLHPDVGGRLFGIVNFHPGADYRYAMAVGASLMLGWTCLLLWADRKPVERRGVLLLTIVPILLGLVAAGIYAVTSHFIAPARMVPIWMLQLILIGLFSFAYFRARGIEQSLQNPPGGSGRG